MASRSRKAQWNISVSTGPGWTELQRIMSFACWLAVTFVKMRMAPLLAAYAGSWCRDWPMPATEEMFTIEPPPARRMAGIACFVPRNTPLAFTAITWSHSATVRSSIGTRGMTMAALLMRMSSRPWRSVAVLTAACQSASLVTSRCT